MDANSSDGNDVDSRNVAGLILEHMDLRERMNARLVNQSWNELALNGVQLKLRIHANRDNVKLEELDAKWAYVDIPAATKADFVQRGSKRNIRPEIVVPGASLNEQIKRLPGALMNRVFDVELRLEQRCLPATGILYDIVSRVSRPVNLQLDFIDTRRPMVSMISNSAMADESIAEEFPMVQLYSLSAIFEFPANGDYSSLNYFRMDNPGKNEQNIHLKLKYCGQSSNELQFVIERFPQLTALKMEFGDNLGLSDENRFSAAPDWQNFSELTSLQELTINGSHFTGLRAPELSKELGLPALRNLRLHNVKLPANETFFQGTPNLNSLEFWTCEHKDNGAGIARADMQTITSAMRNGLLMQLTDASISVCVESGATSLEYLQLTCKAVFQNIHACPKFEQLTWASHALMTTSNDPDAPTLCKALIDLPAGMLGQRPFTLVMRQCQMSFPDNEKDWNGLINAVREAMQHSGLKRLRLPGVRFRGAVTATMICDLINAKPPLSAIIDGNNVLRIIWMHPAVEGFKQQIELEPPLMEMEAE